MGRNTAPCIGLAAVLMERAHGNQPMLVLPADHLVEPVVDFQRLARAGAECVAESDVLLTFGIRPTRPETGYGYIHAGEVVTDSGGAVIREAKAFLEKPTAEKAGEFLRDGSYFWNSGMFMWTTGTILAEIGLHLPELASLLEEIEKGMGTRPLGEVLNSLYPQAPSISIDYGVMEKATRVVVLEADFEWNDVGSWEFIRDIYPADEAGNVAVGEHVLIDARGNTIVSRDRLVGVVGLDDVVVVDGGDTILVCKRDRVQEVKKIVQALRDHGREDLF
jgi:mannose-1-phosphate guanylyltransferase